MANHLGSGEETEFQAREEGGLHAWKNQERSEVGLKI